MKENKNIEKRSFTISGVSDSRHISGYAIVFNSLSNILFDEKRGLFYREIISPEAVTEDLLLSCDIVMNYGHDDDLILARSKYGEGTLQLTLDEHGLKFDFDMPQTAVGEQVLESIRRGDIDGCSFAFSLNEDNPNCDSWTLDENGVTIRTINNIHGIYDCAIVVHEAYSDTEVSQRALNILKKYINDNMNKEELELRENEKDEEVKSEEEPKQEEKQREDAPEKEEEKSEEEPEEEQKEDEEPEKEDEKEDTKEDEEEKRHNKVNKKNNKYTERKFKTMEKRFSLLNAIRSIAEGKKLDAPEAAVVKKGQELFANSGQELRGNIQIPITEFRDDSDPVHYTVEADGEHVVVTDYLNILEPLRAKNVLVKAGATYLTGLKGNIQLPIASDVNAYWEGEITKAQNGAGSFSHINMAPRRMAVEIPISKQFIVQDTLGAENLIRNLLVTKINSKLEETILTNNAAAGNVPAGIFYNVSPTEISDFSDICDFESGLEENNFDGEFKYIVNPKAKAALRCMIKGTNATGMVWDNDEIDGTPADWTTNLGENLIAYGDWSNLYIAQWGGIDLLVDPYTLAGDGQIRLVVNCFFDYKVVRDGAIVLGEYKAGE